MMILDTDQCSLFTPSGNEQYVEALYETYLKNPDSLTTEWRQYFDSLATRFKRSTPDISHEPIQRHFLALARHPKIRFTEETTTATLKQARATEFITAFRRLGHLEATIDPLQLTTHTANSLLTLSHYGLSPTDLSEQTTTYAMLQQKLRRAYCHTIGFEYMHINRIEEITWIQKRIESEWVSFSPDITIKKRLLKQLIHADSLEKYLGFKYVGQKRFSLEGGDSLIPLLDTLIHRSAALGSKEVVIGMAHRGRLNVLINILGKSPQAICDSFEGKDIQATDSGDVKYHLGYSSNVKTADGTLHLALAFNPSHLEIVSPVVQGSVRARQRRRKDTDKHQVIPIQIHGDAAFAGQGVVMETFNMSQTHWFTVGGSIHIVINNQIGFTTDPVDARSTLYCTDVAKMVEPPILHVNANDPEAVYFAALFAIDYRQTFKRDVVIDLVCYRRQGHNEADEPSATQPTIYAVIKKLPVPYRLYADQLIQTNQIDDQTVTQWVNAYRQAMDRNEAVVSLDIDKAAYEYATHWEAYIGSSWRQSVDTAVPLSRIQTLAKQMETLPDAFVLQAQVKKILEARAAMTREDMPINWGYGELMAYATLLDEGCPIRLCGQDSERGTFAHRHAVLHDQKTNARYLPLSHLSAKQAQINIVDSLLSEVAVLAFEYGYSAAVPQFLTIWEAQFGDFANGAQVVIDQFISSGGQKWGRYCGLVMLLPHGYEGQGPEHSSARLERYLQLCAKDNMQVCIPTTPAQIFHLLRRQVRRPYRRPLIVMSPKSLLRHPDATSPLSSLTEGTFQTLIDEIDNLPTPSISRVIFCSGKVYYDLLKERRANQLNNIAILRVEQCYPFDEVCAKQLLTRYASVKEIVWCQEEPQNMGAWTTMQACLTPLLLKGQSLQYAGRPCSASPAVGYHHQHEKEQAQLVAKALQ